MARTCISLGCAALFVSGALAGLTGNGLWALLAVVGTIAVCKGALLLVREAAEQYRYGASRLSFPVPHLLSRKQVVDLVYRRNPIIEQIESGGVTGSRSWPSGGDDEDW